ncbi:helix-turn-helix transcriptional regulator [Streptomyces zhihengii]|uniref:Helix-turn-helix domain-containing protein n=1 Tax=Streptomyces zhihengii TaxID=1818004 RepID=A0ABS2V218_9ACTN|nr:helix-turn-helix domain-containing protein [Streptomyces zhihengii]MBM9623886.1 helix-turn-helix domain-containing protein [Streptomyces zhihengii]
MQTLSFRSQSLEETQEFLSSAYTPMKIGGRPQETGASISRRQVDSLMIDKLDFDYTMAYDAGALEKVCLITVHRGSMVDLTDGRDDVCGPGETYLIAPPDLPYVGEVRGARYTIAMFDPALLDAVAVAGTGNGGPVRFTGLFPSDADGHRRLGSTIAFLRDNVLADPNVSPLVAETAARHLAAVTLATLPTTAAADEPGLADSRDAHTETLRRAMAYIEDNAHEPISIADIATAAFVTPRAVQYAFHRHAGTTPLAHLRRVRLARAHGDLRDAAPHSTSVSEVAARWGFAHAGRFAAGYRGIYGVSPSTTLDAPY